MRDKTEKGKAQPKAAQPQTEIEICKLPMPWEINEEEGSPVMDKYTDAIYNEQDKNTHALNRKLLTTERETLQQFRKDFFMLDETFRMFIVHSVSCMESYVKEDSAQSEIDYNHVCNMLLRLENLKILRYNPMQIRRYLKRLFNLHLVYDAKDFNENL